MQGFAERYISRLEALLFRVLSAGVPSELGAVLPHLRGAPPDVVWPLVGRAADGFALTSLEARNWPEPYEPHPLDYDWVFTPETASWLANLAITSGERIVAFGIPTVHRVLSGWGYPCTLVDRNPLVNSSCSSSFLRLDLCEEAPWPWRSDFDVVLLDAPWYPEILLAWLDQAILAAKDSGVILFSLWGELTRPTASQEREEILDLLSPRGRLTLHLDALSYESPPFERMAFTAAGVPTASRWRRGDLVRLQKYGSGSPLPRPSLHAAAEWHRFTFGCRQVAVRSPRKHCESCIEPIRSAWTLPSVSRRYAARNLVDVWISTNKVASLENSGQLVRALGAIAVGSPAGLNQADLRLLEQVGAPVAASSKAYPWRHYEWMARG